MYQLATKCNVDKKNIYALKKDKWYSLGLVNVKLDQLVHDTPNYALEWEFKGKKGIYVVDTETVDGIVAKNYDLYLIEANYCEDILKEHIENCQNEEEMYYLNRVPNTHLSYEQANKFLLDNMGDYSKYHYIHQSNYNFKEE